MANFDSEFFGLGFSGFQATHTIHAQNSRPELSAFLSNFTFLNPNFIHGDFLLTGETSIFLGISPQFCSGSPRRDPSFQPQPSRVLWSFVCRISKALPWANGPWRMDTEDDFSGAQVSERRCWKILPVWEGCLWKTLHTLVNRGFQTVVADSHPYQGAWG